MRKVYPNSRPKPYKNSRTHARLRHDYASWHEEHRIEVLAQPSRELPYEDRSKFDTFHIIDEAILRSEEYPAQVRDRTNQNFVITFDMGFEVGYDAQAKRRTSGVTVVLSHSGEVITVHPGTPWSRDWYENSETDG